MTARACDRKTFGQSLFPMPDLHQATDPLGRDTGRKEEEEDVSEKEMIGKRKDWKFGHLVC